MFCVRAQASTLLVDNHRFSVVYNVECFHGCGSNLPVDTAPICVEVLVGAFCDGLVVLFLADVFVWGVADSGWLLPWSDDAGDLGLQFGKFEGGELELIL